jgi:hypothetical protein
VPRIGDTIGVVFLVKGDGHLGPSYSCWGSEGVNGVDLLFYDVALLAGFVGMGAHKYHEAVLSLGELGVYLLGASCQVTSL